MNIFISANNTNCGKTYATLKLIKKFSQMGYKVGVMKPIETGIDKYPVDGNTLFEEAKKHNPALSSLNLNDIVPIQFKLPAAPYVAGTADLKKIQSAYKKIKPLCDILLIEGAGGIRVPVRRKKEEEKSEKWRVESGEFQVPGFKFQVPSSRFQVSGSKRMENENRDWIEMWELSKFFDAKLLLVISSKLGMINDFLLNKYFLDSKNMDYLWAVNIFDESYFKITHPFLKQFDPLILQKDLDKIAKKLLGE